MSLSPGLTASCPETKTSPPATIACEYGAPWKGAGAPSVRTTVLPATLSSFDFAGLCQSHAQRLEDRLEHVLRVGSVEQPHVQRHACALRKAFQEAARDIGSEPADARLRKIDVRDDEG